MRLYVVVLAALLVAPLGAALIPHAPPGAHAGAGVAAALSGDAALPVPLVVTFDDHATAARVLGELGDRPGVGLRALPVAFFDASQTELARLLSTPGVRRVDVHEPEPVHLPTATVATRARSVWGPDEGGPMMVGGVPITGEGVGIAVVDSGIMAIHPDLAPNVAANYKVQGMASLVNWFATIFVDEEVPPEFDVMIPADHTDTTSGHGTHVASIAAGTGAASNGRVRGAAPGASIYGFGIGEGLNVLVPYAAASFDWILDNHDKVDPPIRIVTNSWGSDGEYEADFVINQLVSLMVEEGLVVVYAAGNGDDLNNGGDGSVDLTTEYGKNPLGGVLSVANYNDADVATRDGDLASSSSRGLATDATTWPDLSAPGSAIYGALAPHTVSLAFKSIDVFEALVSAGDDDNPFGNAINQHGSNVAFRFGGVTSGTQRLDFVLNLAPAAMYNAHRGAFVTTVGTVMGLSPAEAAEQRRYWDGPEAGAFKSRESASALVEAGDAIVLTGNRGTGNPVAFLVVSPAGSVERVLVRFPCAAGCDAEIDLHALFPGEPRDGTWTIGNGGPSVGLTPEAILAALDPHYVDLSGTSMAAPHVAGIAALMLQANPALTPAQVEQILEETAYAFAFGAAYSADPRHAGGLSSFDKGHGLVDAKAAVTAALALAS